MYPVEANEVFLRVSAAEAEALRGQGFDFYDWGVGEARLVTSWDQDMDAVETLAAGDRGAVSAPLGRGTVLLFFCIIT